MTLEISIMNCESEDGQAVLGRDVQQSIASAATHVRSDNDEGESHRRRQTDVQRIVATYQVSDDGANEDVTAMYQECERMEVEMNNGDEEDSTDCLPESEIRELAMYQWHLRQQEGSGMESNHQQHRLGLEEPTVDASYPRSNHTVPETAQNTWQQLLTGHRGSRVVTLTHETRRVNDYWGDECLDKLGDHIRIYVQNVSGIRLDTRGGRFDSVCQVQKEVQADIVLGQEHNLDSSPYSVRSILHTTSRQHWQRARLNIATTPIAFKNTYKPGGTFMLTVDNATGRIKSQDQDKWGRWVCQTLQGSAGRQVTIVSAYQPVTDTSKPGTVTVATQQHTLLVQQRNSILSPREAFCRDLRAFLVQRREMGDELILVGDFNEEIGSEPSGMLSILQDLQMENLMYTRHGGRPTPAIYSRGRRCLDYGFATPQVCHSLQRCGFEAFGYRFPSDHRAYYFDFQISSLFGTHIQPLSKFEPRLLQSSNAKQVTSYLRRMDELMQASNAYERGDRLAADGNRHRFAERLDSDVLAGSLASERVIPFFHKPEWSLALAQARIRVAILQKTLSCINHNHQFPNRLVEQLGRFCSGWEIQRNKQHCRQQLQKYRAAVDNIVKTSFSQRESELQTKIVNLEMSPLPKDRNQGRSLRQMLACERKCQVFKNSRQCGNGETHPD